MSIFSSRGRGSSIFSSILICIGLFYDIDKDFLSGVFFDCFDVRVVIDRDIGNLRG